MSLLLGDDSAYFVIKMHAELNVELGNPSAHVRIVGYPQRHTLLS